MKQKDVFLESEGNAWFERNAKLLASRNLPGSDQALMEILKLDIAAKKGSKILEIICGDVTRLAWLKAEWMATFLLRKNLESNE